MAKVEKWSEEQQQAFKKKHDLAEPKQWAVLDGRFVHSFHDTEESAKTVAAELDRDEAIAVEFSEWVDRVMNRYSVDHDTVKEIVEAEL